MFKKVLCISFCINSIVSIALDKEKCEVKVNKVISLAQTIERAIHLKSNDEAVSSVAGYVLSRSELFLKDSKTIKRLFMEYTNDPEKKSADWAQLHKQANEALEKIDYLAHDIHYLTTHL